VVAKCPIPGKSKTRLIPLLGEDGTVELARSMLSDVLLTLDGCPALENVHKILLYAPGNDTGLTIMKGIVNQLHLSLVKESSHHNKGPFSSSARTGDKLGWDLLPMLEGDLKASDLGSKLEDALVKARKIMDNNQSRVGGVVFLGMDAPMLSLEDIIAGLLDADTTTLASSSPAMLCPADDGGYGMLCVPPNADPSKTFCNMYWSHSLTAVSQIKALTDQNIMVKIGKMMHDIDDPSDIKALCNRLEESNSDQGEKNLNAHYAAMTDSVTSSHPPCQFTRKALLNAGVLKVMNMKTGI